MRVLMKVKQPFISLIVQKSKKFIVTDKRFDYSGTVSLLDDGIDDYVCKRMNIQNIPESKLGFIRAIMILGAPKKITYNEYYEKRYEHLQFIHERDDFDRDNITLIPILETRYVSPEYEYINTFGEPEELENNDFLFKTHLDYDDMIAGRNLENMDYFMTPLSSVNKDKTSDLNVYCHWHLALNPYLGCSHNCDYCLVRQTYGYNGMWTSKGVVPARLIDIIKQFDEGLFTTKNNLMANLIRKRMPIKIGCSTDPLQPLEKKCGITLGFLEYAKKNDYPYVLITKGVLASTNEYKEQIVGATMLYQQSITTMDEEIARKIESGVRPPKERIDTLQKLSEEGVITQVRIEPGPLLGVNCDLRGNIDKKYYNDFIKLLRDIGVSHVMTRHYTRSPVTDRILKEKIGVDYEKEYKESYEELYGKLLTQNPVIPEPLVYVRFASQLREICDKYGLTLAPRSCIDMKNFTYKYTCCSLDKASDEFRNKFLNGCNRTHPIWVYRLLRDNPDKTFTIDEIMKELQPSVPDVVKHNMEQGWFDSQVLQIEPIMKDGKVIAMRYNKNTLKRYWDFIVNTRA